MSLDYSPQYYKRLKTGACDSAKAIVPLVYELLHPASVVDLGCGTAAWLAEFKRCGVRDILGVDGPHVPANQLEIDRRNFLAADFSEPFRLQRRFDLAMSLEVAEHLDPTHGDQLVETLTHLAPVVVFSAAVPHQGGEHHANEQWPAYWADRFKGHDFVALDPFRRMLWERVYVEWWYAQNLVLYVRRDCLSRFPSIKVENDGIQSYIHPHNYLHHVWQNRVLRVAVDLATITRPGDIVIIADEDQFGTLYLPGRIIRPFIERNGVYFGPPSDDAAAVSELRRMAQDGAGFLAFGWPAFWWLKYYNDFVALLDKKYPVLLKNDNVLVYGLEPKCSLPR
jgi:SAM-dependent methyltransferase